MHYATIHMGIEISLFLPNTVVLTDPFVSVAQESTGAFGAAFAAESVLIEL